MNSFSKYFAMTGWRLGWLLVPRASAARGGPADGQLLDLPAALPQLAAVAAFTPDSIAEADALVEDYAVNRDMLLRGLPEIGLPRLAPADGAFYVYADISDYSTDSLDFCARLLADTGVAIAPGIDFDTVHGGSYVANVVRGARFRHRRDPAADGTVARRAAVSYRALQPPSIVYDAPVTMPALGDASQATRDATSSGSTSRLIALSDSRTFSTTSCSAMPCVRA